MSSLFSSHSDHQRLMPLDLDDEYHARVRVPQASDINMAPPPPPPVAAAAVVQAAAARTSPYPSSVWQDPSLSRPAMHNDSSLAAVGGGSGVPFSSRVYMHSHQGGSPKREDMGRRHGHVHRRRGGYEDIDRHAHGDNSNNNNGPIDRQFIPSHHHPDYHAALGSVSHGSSHRQSSRPSRSRLIIDPDLLILDMRSYSKLEDAIMQVKLFLENVRHLAMKRGWYDMDGGGSNMQPSLFVSIVMMEGGNESPGTILRSVLQEMFRNLKTRFINPSDGESLQVLQVDTLSGFWDEDLSEVINKASASAMSANYGVVEGIIPREEATFPSIRNAHPLTRTSDGHHHAMMVPPAAAMAGATAHPDYPPMVPSSLNDDNNDPLLSSSRHQAMTDVQAEFLQRQSSSCSGSFHSQPPHVPPPRLHEEDLTPMVPSVQYLPQASHPHHYPQDHGDGILHNPFDAVAHSLLTRDFSGDSSNSGSSNSYYNDALSGISTAAGRAEGRGGGGRGDGSGDSGRGGVAHDYNDRGKASDHLGSLVHGWTSNVAATPLANQGGSISYPEDLHQRQLQQPPLLSTSSSDEFVLRAALLLAQAQSSNTVSSLSSDGSSNNCNDQSPNNNPNSDSPPITPPITARSPNTAAARMQQQRRMCPSGRNISCRDNNIDPAIRQAISESQATHMTHTQKQVTHEIQLRRELEMASNESMREVQDSNRPRRRSQQEGGPRGEGGVGTWSAKEDGEVEKELIRKASCQSILDEQERTLKASKAYELELKIAINCSEHLMSQQQEDGKRFKEREEKLIQAVITHTTSTEAEASRQSILDKQERKLTANKAYELELKLAINYLEHLMSQQQEDGKRFKEWEEELIQDVITHTTSMEEEAAQHKEELLQRTLAKNLEEDLEVEEEESLQRALVKSLEEDREVDDEELVEEVIRNSLAESDGHKMVDAVHRNDENTEEMFKRVLKKSLEEK